MTACDYARDLSKSLLVLVHMVFFSFFFFFLSATHIKWCFSSQRLVHDGTDAPQISFGIIVPGHDDLGSLWPKKHPKTA